MKRLSSFIRRFEKQPPLFDELVFTRSRYDNLKVSKVVAENDHMWNTGPAWYFSVGKDGLKACINALSQSHIKSVRRILDIPCGHGRVARHLRAGFPNAEIFFCEIDKSGADFCAKEFGGTAIYSQPEMTDVDMPGSMDGLKLAAAIRHRWPPIELIVVSGKHHLSDADLPTGGRFIGKPFDVPHLTAALQEMAARLH